MPRVLAGFPPSCYHLAMPSITINGKELPFTPGQNILQVALDHEIEIPHYCYHPGMSVVASCRICLAEVWAPNPRNENKLEPIPKLLPTCQTAAADGQVVFTDSPKSIANQKAVMEYLLINHPVDCAVCDQAGECLLQDYSYQYGRSQSRFEERKIKQPKKDLGPHVLLYADRCIMCTRCVRFCREITGTGEITIEGRAAQEQIDIFPGMALDNELSANVIDLCPVGALLDKDFLFQQRVWYLKKTPSIDGITASGDNISIEHNKGVIYRIKPRTNLEVNRWWITDEVRYGWKFVHGEDRLTMPRVRGEEPFDAVEAALAYEAAYAAANDRLSKASSIALLVSPMLSCEEAYLLTGLVQQFKPDATLGVGPVPMEGENKTFRDGFTMYAEKAPNARGVNRVLRAMSKNVLEYDAFLTSIRKAPANAAVVITGNYPSEWVTQALTDAVGKQFVLLIDTLKNRLVDRADVLIPGATWAEKAGTFENAGNRLQSFERAIEPIDFCKGESQIALDLLAIVREGRAAAAPKYNAANIRQQMAQSLGLNEFIAEVHLPAGEEAVESDMELVEL